MNPRRKSRLSVVLFVLLGVAVASALVLYALRQNIDLFYTPSEVVYGKNDNADKKPEVGQRIRVGGMVVAGTVQRDPKSLKVQFDLNDIGPSISVEYEGILPDLFREGQGIVAQGVLKEPTLLEATEVLAKHDENYVPPDLEQQMQKIHKPMGISDLKGESERDRQEKMKEGQ
ncbi:cytochrome c biogenesis protein CcmE [Aggregatibacter actinomycetemcomitans]|uniref:Cytochrome c-type biogenesis protein CcmE n=1 Tax=Aggregatibacter actinomycetemcomitans TaxID=714 RepID=A0A142FYW8_AGGAC|nr:cytochrome c maturation protein CcmE [Aggregatibacter actinomycetemcomitans]AFI87660.1 cytochrome C biogenesis protein CcmE [Aggregatibacter actinomycetemcomitans D7S-1]KYK97103.1 cytochrome C [Aggregatibacter actinomycetemcomitans serotype d str. SA3733]AMQ93598.1 cytochrome C biogenesis protein CcmE [Aggregatibacter actinomycetemcomitans]ANU81178.1 cytochrome c biogenesis protein CcmE [Aggregatibacter actinomycetemcomitans]EKX94014.1 cytochrome C-type biogenesis protein CcmE [Aggregatibac